MDAVASSFRDMDVEYERCVKKAVIYSDQKNELGRFSFGSVFFVRIKKMNSPTGRKHSIQNSNRPDERRRAKSIKNRKKKPLLSLQ